MIAKPDFMLLFDSEGGWIGYLVSNGDGGYNWFDLDAEWKGYMISNSNTGWNIFSTEGEWLAFTT